VGRLILHMFMTLDGVMQAPGEPDEDLEGGFKHGGWQAPYLDEESGRVMFEDMATLDALLLGRKTYDIFAAYWPVAPNEVPFTALLNDAPKFVASQTLESPRWDPTTIIRNVAEDVPRLKGEFKEIHVSGSADLVQSLLRHDLVDRMNLWIYPVLLGTGKRVFAEGTIPKALRLIEARTFTTGTVAVRYERAGEPVYGDTGLDAAGAHWPIEPSPLVLNGSSQGTLSDGAETDGGRAVGSQVA